MRKSNTEKLSDLIRGYVQENNLERKLTEVDMISSWEGLLGKTVARYTQELRISNGTLFIKISSPVVRNELLMMKEEIRKRLNERAGKEMIKQIVFK
jgi:predicted nucleic acid-binding Zn ribbon protein